MGMPAARTSDTTAHGSPLMPGPGSPNVIIGFLPAWRGLPAAAAAALQAAKAVSDAAIKVAEAATVAAAGTPGAPAALAAETAAKTAASAALASMMSSLAGASTTPSGGTPDMHLCPMPSPPTPIPHGMGYVIDGSTCVLTNGLPQCALGDTVLEAIGPPNKIVKGESTVLIGKGGAGGGFMAALMDAIKGLIDKALAAANAVAEFAKDMAAFVRNLVNAVVDGIRGMVARFTQAVVDAVAKALKALADAFTPPVTTDLGKEVDAILNMSPTMRANIDQLQEDGWTIKYGEAGKGSFADRKAKEIVFDPNNKDNHAYIAQTMAHESGHALYTPDPYVPHTGLTKDDYVDRNVNSGLKDEGEATLTNAEIRREITDAGGPDVGIAGSQSDKYQEIADKYPDPGDRDKARQEIADLFGDGEKPSTDPTKTYREYYGKTYEDFYDANPQP
jgi:uncharacterized Zn-binding protein involved in type VI secretion